MEKGFGKEGDGATRHFRHTGIVILTKIAIPIRPKHGTFYDGTAALNRFHNQSLIFMSNIDILKIELSSRGVGAHHVIA